MSRTVFRLRPAASGRLVNRLPLVSLFLISLLMAGHPAQAQMNQDELQRRVRVRKLREKFREAFSPVGQWTITKMDVQFHEALGVGGAQGRMDLHSSLVSGGFTMSPGGGSAGKGDGSLLD
jgi:hypothetical protein